MSAADHDATTRRVVISYDGPDDSMDSMEMTAVRPESQAAHFEESLDVTIRRPPPLTTDLVDLDGEVGETIAIPARARAAVAGARPAGVAGAPDLGPRDGRSEGKPGTPARGELVDARKRLVGAGASRARSPVPTPEDRRRR